MQHHSDTKNSSSTVAVPAMILIDLCEAARQEQLCKRSYAALRNLYDLSQKGCPAHPIIAMQPSLMLRSDMVESLLRGYENSSVDMEVVAELEMHLSSVPNTIQLPLELSEDLVAAHISGKVYLAYMGSTRPDTEAFTKSYADVMTALKKLAALKP